MAIILNETKEAERILRTGEVGKKPTYTLFLLGRYFRQKENLGKQGAYEKLDEFMRKNYKGYNSAQWENYIEDAAKKGLKYPLREIESVDITQKELRTISVVDNVRYEKLLFTMLCYAKFYDLLNPKNNGWVNADIKDIYSAARVTVQHRNDKFLYLNDLEQMGLISFSNRNDNLNMKVNYIYPDSKVVYHVKDFRELGYEYLMALGDKEFIRCQVCGRLVRVEKEAMNRKYCPDCAKKVQRQQKKSYEIKKKLEAQKS